MAGLDPNMVLRRIPDVQVQISSDNNIQLLSDDVIYHLGPHGLAILDTFYQPVTVSEALRKLSATSTGVQDWMSLTTTIVQLYNAGILRDETQNARGPKIGRRGFGGPGIHISMLNDRSRTSGYLTGIAEMVRPGDVVVDIGTGTGVLAVAAARAGAEHVYAIEASAIGEVAEAVFEANGLVDRITLVRGWSTRIDLPERADVLVSEIIGNEPLGENVLEVTRDARKRLLKADARLVPSKVRVFGLPVTIPQRELSTRTLTADTLQNWQSWYGIDFGPLGKTEQDEPRSFYIRPQKACDWETLSGSILLAEVDLGEVDRLIVDSAVTVNADASGTLNGLLVFFELDLSPSTSLSTHPAQAHRDCSWFSRVWIVKPLPLQKNDQFSVTYQYRATGASHNVTVARA